MNLSSTAQRNTRKTVHQRHLMFRVEVDFLRGDVDFFRDATDIFRVKADVFYFWWIFLMLKRMFFVSIKFNCAFIAITSQAESSKLPFFIGYARARAFCEAINEFAAALLSVTTQRAITGLPPGLSRNGFATICKILAR